MSIDVSLACFEYEGREINLLDTPGEPSFIADAISALRAADAAVVVVNGVAGVEVSTERLWRRADAEGLARLVFVNMLDRERADFFAALDSLKSAFGPHVVATEIPIGAEHELRGVIDLIDLKAFVYEGDGREREGRGGRDPRGAAGARRGVPGEADGRGRGELRRADGALPRGRGDRPRGDRRRPQARRHRGASLPGHLRRGDPQPRHRPPARGACRGPALAGDARPAGRARRRGGGGRDRARRRRAAARLRLQDARRSLRGPHQPLPRLPRHDRLRLPGGQRDPPPEGADRPALAAARQGPRAVLRARRRRHRRDREAEGDPGGRRPLRAPGGGRLPAARPAGAGDGVRLRSEVEGRRGEGRGGGAAG